MNDRNTLEDVLDDIDNEGFDYAMSGWYRSYEEIKDEKFQELFAKYKEVRKELTTYLGVDE